MYIRCSIELDDMLTSEFTRRVKKAVAGMNQEYANKNDKKGKYNVTMVYKRLIFSSTSMDS
jgi:hypothetical protein